jgi:arylsulfatase A-like enzyme
MQLSRRHFFFGTLALPAFAAKKPAKAAPERPNLLLLVADHVPSWALGVNGNAEFHTPNLDRLARTGTRFRNHLVAAPAPDPGRASLLTGRTPMQPPAAALDKLLEPAGYVCGTSDAAGAARFLDSQTAGKPFFLTVNLTSPRLPYDDVAQKYRDLYASSKFDNFVHDPAAPNARLGKEMLADLVPSLRKYGAALTAMDDEVQSVLSRIQSGKLADNTLTVFTSTCGALLGRHGLWAAGEASDPPNMYEEAVDTPMVWSWLGRIPAESVRPELVGSCDFVPSICDLADADLPSGNYSGRSYVALATGKPLPKKQPWRTRVFAQLGDTGMARIERYKVVERPHGPGELYDLVADAAERTNQYDNPNFVSVRDQLRTDLAAWKQKYSS